MVWETVIGLEVHAQLKTHTKLFSGTAIAYGASPNSQTSFIDAGLPGVLPVLNQTAVQMAIQFGLAIGAEINDLSYFERKNYFYPDLPKGYQISQFQRPIVSNGELVINTESGQTKTVNIIRAHLEEDAGKSSHEAHPTFTGVDLNRAGTPLLEIVTSPCLRSAAEAVAYLRQLHQLVRFLGICDGNMQEGSFRCDVNISLRPKGSERLGTRTELKNLNSFRFIEKAIHFEELRHQELLENGQAVIQETRLYAPTSNTTHPMRSKETENDYRYFPDPDLLPIKITVDDINLIKNTMPPLPQQIKDRLQTYSLNEEEIHFLLSAPSTLQFFDLVKASTLASAKSIVNWLRGPFLSILNERGTTFECPFISAQSLARLLDALHDNKISNQTARSIFTRVASGEEDIELLLSSTEFATESDTQALETYVIELIEANPQQAADYRAGKEKLLGFFVGQVMKEMKGRYDPGLVNTVVKKLIKK
jgi:aspartyl-tRNA(Asn)/glutamyl-tRNA(Gln) amidotransferase subunit B